MTNFIFTFNSLFSALSAAFLLFSSFNAFGQNASSGSVRQDVSQTTTYIQLGLSKTDNGDFVGAIKDFDRAIARSLASAEAYRYRSYAKLQIGDYNGVVQDCSEAIRINSQDSNAALAYLYRAYAKFALKQYEGATHDCTSAIRLDPFDEEAMSLRGMAKLQLNDYVGAQNDYTEALRLNHANAMYFFMRGQARAQTGDLIGAIGDFTMTLQLEPQATQALVHRARVKIVLQDADACNDLRQAVEKGSTEGQAMLSAYCR